MIKINCGLVMWQIICMTILEVCQAHTKMTKYELPVNTYGTHASLEAISSVRDCAHSQCHCAAIEMLKEGGFRSLNQSEAASADPANLLTKGKFIKSYATADPSNLFTKGKFIKSYATADPANLFTQGKFINIYMQLLILLIYSLKVSSLVVMYTKFGL